jgi:hypothetical protein
VTPAAPYIATHIAGECFFEDCLVFILDISLNISGKLLGTRITAACAVLLRITAL